MGDDLSYIIEPLREHAVPVDDLKCDLSNANRHPPENFKAIMESLKGFGQRQVIVAKESDHTVIAGNARLRSARALGWSHIACVFVDDDEMTALRYAIADNRTSELSQWDEDVLSQVLQTIDEEHGEVESIGFSEQDIDDLVAEIGPIDDATLEGPQGEGGGAKRQTWVECPECSHRFELDE